MNIMITVTNMTAANGGVTTHIVDLCKELMNRNIRVILLSDRNGCDYCDQISELEKNDLFKFISVNMEGVQSSLKRFAETVKIVKSIVKNENIDLIHTHSQSFCVVGAVIKRLTGVPYIWTNHIDEMANPKLFKHILDFLNFPIISVSTDLKNMLINDFGVNEKRITVVNNGINLQKFDMLSECEKELLRSDFHCKDKYVIALLARMSYGKGHMYLLEAVNYLQSRNDIKDIKVLIAGKCHDHEKEYLENLKTYSIDNNIDMEFIGFQNPKNVFGIADISVLPSIYEGFGLTVIESLAMECPVIRSKTPGWMDTQGIALNFEKRDVEGLYEQLLYAYEHKNELVLMGKRGREQVQEKFTIQNQVDETINVYQKCIKRGKNK